MSRMNRVAMLLLVGCGTRTEPARPEPYAVCRGVSDAAALGLCIARERMAYARRERDVIVMACEQDKIERLETLQQEPTAKSAQEAVDRGRRAIELARAARNCQGFIPAE